MEYAAQRGMQHGDVAESEFEESLRQTTAHFDEAAWRRMTTREQAGHIIAVEATGEPARTAGGARPDHLDDSVPSSRPADSGQPERHRPDPADPADTEPAMVATRTETAYQATSGESARAHERASAVDAEEGFAERGRPEAREEFRDGGTGRVAARGVDDEPRAVEVVHPLSADALRGLTLRAVSRLVGETVVRPGDERSAVLGDEVSSVTCVTLLESLSRELYPRAELDNALGRRAYGSGVRAARAVDDLHLGTHSTEQRLAHGPGWHTVSSWSDLVTAVEKVGPGSSALILQQRQRGFGHAFALYHRADGMQWLDLQRGDGLRAAPEHDAAPHVRAVVIDRYGKAVPVPQSLPTFIGSRSVLALTDLPTSHEYRGIGMEIERPNVRLWSVLGGNEWMQHGRTVAADGNVSLTSELVEGSTPFLEVVTRPIAVHHEEYNSSRVRKEDVFRSLSLLEQVVGPGRAHMNVPFATAVSQFGFQPSTEFHDVEYRRRNPPPGGIEYPTQFTVGVPLSAVYDFGIQHAKSTTDPKILTEIIPGLEAAGSFARRVAAEYLARRINMSGPLEIPEIASAYLDDMDFRAIKSMSFAVFSQAIGVVQFNGARSPNGPWHKSFLSMASRHHPWLLRQALSPAARQFLSANAQFMYDQFNHFASYANEGFANPISAVIDVKNGVTRTVRDYLNDFLFDYPAPRIRQEDLQIGSVHETFDLNDDEYRRPRLPLALGVFELRNIASQRDLGELRETYDQLENAVRGTYDRELQRSRAGSVNANQQFQTLQELSRNPYARQLETILAGAAELNMTGPLRELGWELISHQRTEDLVKGVMVALGANLRVNDHEATRLRSAAVKTLEGLNLRLGEFASALASKGNWATHVEQWRGIYRANRSLLGAIAPNSATLAPPSDTLTTWYVRMYQPGHRPQDLAGIDAQVSAYRQTGRAEHLTGLLASIGAWYSAPARTEGYRDMVRSLRTQVSHLVAGGRNAGPAPSAQAGPSHRTPHYGGSAYGRYGAPPVSDDARSGPSDDAHAEPDFYTTPVSPSADAARALIDAPEQLERPIAARNALTGLLARMLLQPEVRARLVASGARVVIVPRGVETAALPGLESVGGDLSRDAVHYWETDGVRTAVGVVAEENLLGQEPGLSGHIAHPDGYSTATHEVAHLVFRHGLSADQQARVSALYEARKATPGALWPDGSDPRNYSATDVDEYFAQATNVYFGVNHGRDAVTGEVRNNGADWLRVQDGELAGLFAEIYGDPAELPLPSANPREAVAEEAGRWEGFRSTMDPTASPEFTDAPRVDARQVGDGPGAGTMASSPVPDSARADVRAAVQGDEPANPTITTPVTHGLDQAMGASPAGVARPHGAASHQSVSDSVFSALTPEASTDASRPHPYPVEAGTGGTVEPAPHNVQVVPHTYEAYHTVSPGLVGLVKRIEEDDLEYAQEPLANRLPDGSLHPDAPADYHVGDEAFKPALRAAMRQAGLFPSFNTTDDNLRGLPADILSSHPEISTYLYGSDPNLNNRIQRRETVHEGVTLDIRHARENDPLVQPRLDLLKDVISFVHATGLDLPSSLKVYVPRYTRRVEVVKSQRSGRIEVGVRSVSVDLEPTAIGQVSAPDAVMLTPLSVMSHAVGHPAEDDHELAGVLANPSFGWALHEAVHLMHNAYNPLLYVDLAQTEWATPEIEQLAAHVSSYATESPGEFVAEYGTGLLLGRTYETPEITEALHDLYVRLGGPVPPAGSVPPLHPPKAAELEYLTHEVNRLLTERGATPRPDAAAVLTAHDGLTNYQRWINLPDRARALADVLAASSRTGSEVAAHGGRSANGDDLPHTSDETGATSGPPVRGPLDPRTDLKMQYAAQRGIRHGDVADGDFARALRQASAHFEQAAWQRMTTREQADHIIAVESTGRPMRTPGGGRGSLAHAEASVSNDRLEAPESSAWTASAQPPSGSVGHPDPEITDGDQPARQGEFAADRASRPEPLPRTSEGSLDSAYPAKTGHGARTRPPADGTGLTDGRHHDVDGGLEDRPTIDAGAALADARSTVARAEADLRAMERAGDPADDVRLAQAYDDLVWAQQTLSEAEAHWTRVTGEELPADTAAEGEVSVNSVRSDGRDSASPAEHRDGTPRPETSRQAVDPEAGTLPRPADSLRSMDLEAIRNLVDDVAETVVREHLTDGAGTTGAHLALGARLGLDEDAQADVLLCIAVQEALQRTVRPGLLRGVLDGAVSATRGRDDGDVAAGGGLGGLAPRHSWNRITEWGDVTSVLAPDEMGLVALQRQDRPGHLIAVYRHPTAGMLWLDPTRAPGERVSDNSPAWDAVGARAVVLLPGGVPRADALPHVVESSSQAQALLDAPADARFGVHYGLVHPDDRDRVRESSPDDILWRFSPFPPEKVFTRGFNAPNAERVVTLRSYMGLNNAAQYIGTSRDRDLWYGNRRYRYEIQPGRSSDPEGRTGIDTRSWEKEVAFTSHLEPETVVSVYDRTTGSTGHWDPVAGRVQWTRGDHQTVTPSARPMAGSSQSQPSSYFGGHGAGAAHASVIPASVMAARAQQPISPYKSPYQGSYQTPYQKPLVPGYALNPAASGSAAVFPSSQQQPYRQPQAGPSGTSTRFPGLYDGGTLYAGSSSQAAHSPYLPPPGSLHQTPQQLPPVGYPTQFAAGSNSQQHHGYYDSGEYRSPGSMPAVDAYGNVIPPPQGPYQQPTSQPLSVSQVPDHNAFHAAPKKKSLMAKIFKKK
ncbi:toxin glutamine deamidase domain-containing protein [Streptomyces sp. NPDC096057]|uniref:toxin glutamine deamidase domain-containing protein n=1 Tax=Streptomyces sp. NPDC096057 TaxID=3155543 RepID=UPI003321894B